MTRHNHLNSPVSLIGIPLDLGAENLGVDIGPDAFRHQKIIDKLNRTGLAITDHGNIAVAGRAGLDPGSPNQRYLPEILSVSQRSAELTEAQIRAGHRIVGLGGDHSVTLGLVSGARAALTGAIGLIYFDAHGDMNTPDTTLTGNVHGMHLAALLGFGEPKLTNFHGPSPKIEPQNLLHIAGNDFDQAELDLIAREHLAAFTLTDVLTQGLGPLFKRINDLAARVDHIWVSFDLDAIDRLYAPGAGMPNPGGLTYREVAALATHIGQTCPVAGLDIVEYNPLTDEHSRTAELGIELIAKLLGHDYNWYSDYLARNDVNR